MNAILKHTFIVKVQISLHTNEEEPQFLIYNEPRSIEVQFPESAVPHMRDALGGRTKGYFRAYLDARGKLQLVENAPDQSW